MENSCRPSCAVCAQPPPIKEVIADQLFWNEPFDSIQTIFRVSALDLDRHSANDPGVSAIRKTDFPFFENAGFLLLSPAAHDYLVWTRERVRKPLHEADKRFCVLVGLVADSFLLNSNLKNFLDYSQCFATVQKIVAAVNIAEIPDEVFLSDDGLNSLPDHWFTAPPVVPASFEWTQQSVKPSGEMDGLMPTQKKPTKCSRQGREVFAHPLCFCAKCYKTRNEEDRRSRSNERDRIAGYSQDWRRIRNYGHGAVALHQIALLADKEICPDGSIRLLYTDEAKVRWFQRTFWAFLRLRFWIERIIPTMRSKESIDIAYHTLRVSFPFDPPGAAPLYQNIKGLTGIKKVQRGSLSSRDSQRLENARKELDGLYSSMPELQNI